MTVNRAPACAVLLAAGFSSRMHALKPLLPFGDGTVLARTAGIWRRAGVERLVLVTGHRAEEIEAEAARLALPCVRNPRPEEGMFASLKLGLARCLELWGPDTGASAEETAREAGGQAAAGNDLWIGVLPADMPLVAPATIRRLLEVCAVTRADLVKPVFAGRNGHPPMLRRAIVPQVLADPGADGLRGALKAFSLERVPVNDSHINTDMDTPEDYARALAELDGR